MSNQMLLVIAIAAVVAIVVFLAAALHSRRATRDRGSLFGPDAERLLHPTSPGRNDRHADALPLRH